MFSLPKIHLLATGGTIAGTASNATDTANYSAAALGADTLLAALPEAGAIARIASEQLFARDSKDLQPADWLQLAQRLRELIAQDDRPDGIVITHGTDTIEETAFFLSLTLPRTIPIVLTAAMRPATARSADGPMNLLQAIAAAAEPRFSAAGPLVATNDRLWRACDVTKRHTHAPDALGGFEAAPFATAVGTRWNAPHALSEPDAPLFCDALPAALPEVWILPGYAGAPAELVDGAVERGVRGLVLALAGHGSVPQAWEPAIGRALEAGVAIVRASRVAVGGVTPDANYGDTARGTIASAALSPVQARILLMLCLAFGDRPADIRARFARS
jgi:L-asparaginase